MKRVPVIADVIPRPSVESSISYPGDVVWRQIIAQAVALVGGTPKIARSRVDRHPDAVAQPGGEYAKAGAVGIVLKHISTTLFRADETARNEPTRNSAE